MKSMTTDERVAGAALLLGAVAAMALLPVWAPVAVAWMLATGRSLRSCGREANRMSGGDEGEA
jgi:hypothetical protein